MATETLAPDAVLVGTNYTTLNIGDVDEDPAASDGSWGAWDGNGNTIASVSFPTPTGAPTAGATQTFRVLVRKTPLVTNPATTWSLQLYEGGSLVATLATGTTAALDPGEVISGTWDAASLSTADGSAVECRLVQTAGGTGGTRRGIEVGAFAWDVVYSATNNYTITGAVTAALAVAAALAFNSHPQIAGAVTTTLTPAATVTYNRHAAVDGAVGVSLTPAATLIYNRHAALTGSVAVALTPAATMQYAVGGAEIAGAVTVELNPAGTMAWNQHPATTGTLEAVLTPAASLQYQRHPALSGAVNATLTPAATMVYNRHTAINGGLSLDFNVAAAITYTGANSTMPPIRFHLHLGLSL